jgi:reactive intermediate/imine deaminase
VAYRHVNARARHGKNIKSQQKETATKKMKQIVETQQAPKAIGPYSQAVRAGNVVYMSGQIPLDPATMQIVSDDIAAQAEQVFLNLRAVSEAAGGQLDAIVKLTIFLTDLNHFSIVNETMSRFFKTPYPARSTIEVSALPKAALVEIEAIMVL